MNTHDLLQQALDALKGVVRWGVDNGRTLNLSVTTDSEVAKRIYKAIAAIEAAQAQPSPAVELPVVAWMQSGSLLYRLNDDIHPRNCDEINVTMADG